MKPLQSHSGIPGIVIQSKGAFVLVARFATKTIWRRPIECRTSAGIESRVFLIGKAPRPRCDAPWLTGALLVVLTPTTGAWQTHLERMTAVFHTSHELSKPTGWQRRAAGQHQQENNRIRSRMGTIHFGKSQRSSPQFHPSTSSTRLLLHRLSSDIAKRIAEKFHVGQAYAVDRRLIGSCD